MLSIAQFIISPKIIMIFIVNYKIVYDPNDEYKDAIDFIRKNKKLIRVILNKIRDIIIRILIKKVLKEISLLVGEQAARTQKEKGLNNVAQLLSLVGTPQEVIRMITNLA
jgi:hypothetical protein